MATVQPAGPPLRADDGRGQGRSWGLPLLAKELTELAARPRTFTVRVIYAAVLLVICYGVLVAYMPSSRFAVNALGAGLPVLGTLSVLQTLGLYLVLPILACSTLTVEKERQTLDLLLITKLGPWTIIFEKFLGQLVPAIYFVMLSLPLLAFSYALGGLTLERIALAMLELVLTATRLAAVGIMCSAMFRTTSRALIATYLLVVVVGFCEFLIQAFLVSTANQLMTRSSWIDFRLEFENVFSVLNSNPILASSIAIPFATKIGLGCLSSLLCSGLCLVLARYFAVPPVRGWIGWLFRIRMRFSAATRRPLISRDISGDRPIAWREGPRGSLVYWWWKNSICLEVLPVLLILAYAAFTLDEFALRYVVATVYYCLWLAVTVRICTCAASLIVKERVHQTLDILCCTPLTAKDIINQKMDHVWRMVNLSRVSLIICVAFRTLFFPSGPYLIGAGLMIWLYPSVIAWQTMSCGMSARSSAGAILRSILTLAGWSIVPLIVTFFLAVGGGGPGSEYGLLFFASVSPLVLPVITEAFPASGVTTELIGAFIVVLLMTGIVQFIRVMVLRDWVATKAEAELHGIPMHSGFKN